MKRSPLFAAAASVLLATTAHAGTKLSKPERLGSAGNWTVYHYASNDTGNPMCVMKSIPVVGSTVHVTYYYDVVRIDLFKASWKIPNGTSVSLSVRFDNKTPFIGQANGVPNAQVGGSNVMLSFGEADAKT